MLTNFIHTLVRKVYRHQQLEVSNGRYYHAPKSTWGNDYPIVLVHGYFGTHPDASTLGNYFTHAMSKYVLKRGFNYRQDCYFKDVFIASVSPMGGAHDRACELYQQLVGISDIRRKCGFGKDYTGPELVKAVYGQNHVCDQHSRQTMYKPRYLRQIRGGDTSQQLFAFPDGLPGGWSAQRKVHLIAHSQGAIVCRYLQYLLRIDYFAHLEMPSIPKSIVDRSNYIASLTTLNGAHQASSGPLTLDCDEETMRFYDSGPKATCLSRIWLLTLKVWIIA